MDWHSGDGHVGVCIDMRRQHLLEVHAVKLVTRKNQNMLDAVFFEKSDLLANGVRSSLVPVVAIQRLLCSQNFHEPVMEQVKVVSLSNVTMQTDGVKLRQNIHAIDVAVDAVGNRHVDQSVLATQWNGWLGSILRQRQ